MVVRIMMRLESTSGAKLTVPAILSTALESEEPELIVPEYVAEKLGLYPELPPETEIGDFEDVGGMIKARGYRIRGLVKAWVETEDKEVGPCDIAVTVVLGEEEALLGDRLIDELGLEILKPGEGLWRFRGEAVIRKSVETLTDIPEI
jgi:hypothetical protein